MQIVLDLIRNKPADMALAILKHTPKAACEDLEKLLKSAMANAENNHNMDTTKLYVADLLRSAGPHPQAYPSQSTGPCVPHFEENVACHHRA